MLNVSSQHSFNYEDALKSIQDRIGHVFGPLLQVWFIMEVEKEAVLADPGLNIPQSWNKFLPYLSNRWENKRKRDIKGTVRFIKPYWQQFYVWVTFWKWIL